MKSNKHGAIVNISSQAGISAIQDHAVYAASKAALDQLTRVFALELGQYNIRVNSVNPTVTLTPMSQVSVFGVEVSKCLNVWINTSISQTDKCMIESIRNDLEIGIYK